jgi:hypothetical protein
MGNPTNDDFNHPIDITDFTTTTYSNGEVRNYTLRGHNTGTTNPGEPLPHAVWYRWTAPDTGRLDTTISFRRVLPYGHSDQRCRFQSCHHAGHRHARAGFQRPGGRQLDQYEIDCDFRPTPKR